jgi:uncharacterized protein (DUF885 family)
MLPLLSLILLAPNAEDAKLAKLFDAYLAAEFERHPVFASALGKHDHDHRMDDLNPASRAKDIAITEAMLTRLNTEIDRAKLSPAVAVDWEIWQHALSYQLWSVANDNRFEYDPRVYGEYHTDSVFSLFAQSTLPKPRIVANAAQRIAAVPKVISAAKASLKAPPRILTEVAIQRTRGSIAFYEKEIYALSGETPATSELKAPADAAIAALKDFLAYLENDLLAKSSGEWRLGAERFGKKLELELNAGLSAADVLALAEAEAIRVDHELYVTAKQLWYRDHPGQALPPDDAAGRRQVVADVLASIGKDHGSANSLLGDAKTTVSAIKEFITAKKILTLPDPDRCAIIEMPEFQRGFSAAYLNPAPLFDPQAQSLYAVSPPPSDWPAARQTAFLEEYNRRMLQILTIHEAYPGHYVQLEYANRNPSLIRKVFGSGVYSEGWAVYTEQMMLDQGFGSGDPALRMQQLKFYLRAVLNAILDHKMHCTAMTDDDALKLLMVRGFQTEGEAVGKIRRAKQSSCQLSTYFVGRNAFYKLRVDVSRARGAAFDLGAFHEAVLNEGSIPVKYLPRLVK